MYNETIFLDILRCNSIHGKLRLILKAGAKVSISVTESN